MTKTLELPDEITDADVELLTALAARMAEQERERKLYALMDAEKLRGMMAMFDTIEANNLGSFFTHDPTSAATADPVR
jgi:hypothetical protein